MFLLLDRQTQYGVFLGTCNSQLPLTLRPLPMTVLPKELANPRLHATCKGWRDASAPSSHLPLLNQYVSCNPLDRISFCRRRENSIELKLASVIYSFML
jgi:hypothetical protein